MKMARPILGRATSACGEIIVGVSLRPAGTSWSPWAHRVERSANAWSAGAWVRIVRRLHVTRAAAGARRSFAKCHCRFSTGSGRTAPGPDPVPKRLTAGSDEIHPQPSAVRVVGDLADLGGTVDPLPVVACDDVTGHQLTLPMQIVGRASWNETADNHTSVVQIGIDVEAHQALRRRC